MADARRGQLPPPGGSRLLDLLRPPQELAVADEERSEEHFAQRDQAWADATSQTLMQASEVADKVFKAIEDEQFYILPHEDDAGVRARLENILARRNPAPGRFA